MGGDAADLVIGRHDIGGAGARDGRLEGREEHLPQRSLRDLRRGDIRTALRLSVTGHVLEGGKHVAGLEPVLQGRLVTLETLHRSHAELAYKIRIFAVGLFDSSPTRIACDV